MVGRSEAVSPARVYYNDSEPFVCDWLENLIREQLLPDGVVDRRPIQEVEPKDVRDFTQCHFFAGIGGWACALQLAGWGDRRAWTGSCPCQPLSVAGNRQGHADQRHIWPAFHRLITECRPPVVFGEQVASKDGREWLAGVRADLEAVGYACGAADLCAASVGAPHPRQRLYWVADAGHQQSRWGAGPDQAQGGRALSDASRRRHVAQGMADADEPRQYGRAPSGEQSLRDERGAGLRGLGDATSAGLEGEWREYRPSGERHSGLVGLAMQTGVPEWNGATVAAQCADGARRVSAQPDAFPLAHGVRNRMGILRGAGNAIVPQVAAAFVMAYLDVVGWGVSRSPRDPTMSLSRVVFSAQSPHHATPEALYRDLDAEFHFTLDPCPLGGGEDGLARSWRGERVYCNPPYGRGVGEWLAKAAEASLAVFLLPARTDTKWWHEYAPQAADGAFHPRAAQVRWGKVQCSISKRHSRVPFRSPAGEARMSRMCPNCNAGDDHLRIEAALLRAAEHAWERDYSTKLPFTANAGVWIAAAARGLSTELDAESRKALYRVFAGEPQ